MIVDLKENKFRINYEYKTNYFYRIFIHSFNLSPLNKFITVPFAKLFRQIFINFFKFLHIFKNLLFYIYFFKNLILKYSLYLSHCFQGLSFLMLFKGVLAMILLKIKFTLCQQFLFSIMNLNLPQVLVIKTY